MTDKTHEPVSKDTIQKNTNLGAALAKTYIAAQRVINPDKLMWHDGFSREGWYRWHPVVGYLFTGAWADEVPS